MASKVLSFFYSVKKIVSGIKKQSALMAELNIRWGPSALLVKITYRLLRTTVELSLFVNGGIVSGATYLFSSVICHLT
jgi:hypothetical protein